jgi:hypothetical protein
MFLILKMDQSYLFAMLVVRLCSNVIDCYGGGEIENLNFGCANTTCFLDFLS